MDLSEEIKQIIGKPESSKLEYKAVLPTSKNIAKIICSFANTEGGYIILGVLKKPDGKINVTGLSEDFHANAIIHKALDLLSSLPEVYYQYVVYNDKKIYVIKVEESDVSIKVDGRQYIRDDGSVKVLNPSKTEFKQDGYSRLKDIHQKLQGYMENATEAKIKLIEHYQSILKIIDDLNNNLYPTDVKKPTNNQEGKILSRILFSSFVDNFETYLSDLLYEIFLANPATLKSKQKITIEEVLNCSDLQEFVKYWAKEKISKLQKGSVKGFIKENNQINDLDVLDENEINDIERILQIRHLYIHRNGIVDEKFIQYFPGYELNSQHQMSIEEVCEKLEYLSEITDDIDSAAIDKYNLV